MVGGETPLTSNEYVRVRLRPLIVQLSIFTNSPFGPGSLQIPAFREKQNLTKMQANVNFSQQLMLSIICNYTIDFTMI